MLYLLEVLGSSGGMATTPPSSPYRLVRTQEMRQKRRICQDTYLCVPLQGLELFIATLFLKMNSMQSKAAHIFQQFIVHKCHKAHFLYIPRCYNCIDKL
jgi:hypothetical protein